MISLNLVLAGLRLGLKNCQVGEKWVYDDYSYLCKGLTVYFLIIIFENENITNTLTKLLAVVIFSVSLNAFSLIPLAPFITISANHVSATVGTAITPVTVTNTGAAASYYSNCSCYFPMAYPLMQKLEPSLERQLLPLM
ncbi:hypothetical protein BSPWISOXPB_3049 [uncultured Gammaproteobacteria bacterium]|nr:hypothetical protein BSPWISOXPB_3049 [uncultured Gammaproteobacteria bacterium]